MEVEVGADSWRPQMDSLRDDFDVIAVDLRGQFGSETTAAGYDLWNQRCGRAVSVLADGAQPSLNRSPG